MFAATSFLALAMSIKLYSSTALGCLAHVRHGRGIRGQRRPRLSRSVTFYQTARFRFYQTCHSEERSDEESAAHLRLARKRFLTSFGMTTMKTLMNRKVVLN